MKNKKIRIIGIITAAILVVSGAIFALWPRQTFEHTACQTVSVSAAPDSIHAQKHIDTTIALELPADTSKVSADDIFLYGYFEGLEAADVESSGNQLTFRIKGEPVLSEAYDPNVLQYDGEISIAGDADTIYTTMIPIVYPQLEAEVDAFEYQDSYDETISLTLINDSLKKAPTQSDIELRGVFKDMQVSDVVQEGNTLSFHIKGESNEDSLYGQVVLSGDVLDSGISVQKNFSFTDAPELFSIEPITIEQPFRDTITLRLLHDYFKEDISADMLELQDGLKNMDITDVQYLDPTSIAVGLSGEFVNDIGYGTISLSDEAIETGRSISANIAIEAPSISMQSDDHEILAPKAGNVKEYVVTIYSAGEDFIEDTLTPEDFTLEGVLGGMEITSIRYIGGYEAELTLKGSPKAGEGTVTLSAQELGNVKNASCVINVVDLTEFFGSVNLADYLPDMTVTFYDQDDNLLDIPSAATDEFGHFFVSVTSGMPVEEIAFIKAKNDEFELCAPFDWADRANLYINGFTTLMARAILGTEDQQQAIEQVYRYLELENAGYIDTNYSFIGTNNIFSHELFEQQADGDIDGFIIQLMDEMKADETHSFADISELSGQTGGMFDTVLEWGLEKIKVGAIEGLKVAGKEGSLAMLRKAGILKPSTRQMLNQLQKSVDQLSDQVRAMQVQLTYEIKSSEVERKLDRLSDDLNTISFLYSKYTGLQSKIEKEVDTYNKEHPNQTGEIDKSKLPVTTSFFGKDGAVAKKNLDERINSVINTLNGTGYTKPLITEYYHILKEELPFEHNSARQLYAFMQHVTSIETIGLQLYASHCLYADDPTLSSFLDTVQNAYANSVTVQEQKLLPDERAFKINDGYCKWVKLNYTGKFYSFPVVTTKMKEDLIIKIYHPVLSNGYSCYRYMADGYGYDSSEKDINDLFHCRSAHHKGLSRKEYLKRFLGVEYMPDWLLVKLKAKRKSYDVTFYDIADNVYRTKDAKDLYENYSSWRTQVFGNWNNYDYMVEK